MYDVDMFSVQQALGPLAVAFGLALRPVVVWLARFLGSWLMMGIFGFIAELLPRLLGLGQGLLSWGFGVLASASFSAFQTAMSIAGVQVPSFRELLSDLPPGVLWMCSALRVHKIVFIMASVLIVKLLRRVMEHAASAAVRTSAGSLMGGGR
jgi:hypothetical protein